MAQYSYSRYMDFEVELNAPIDFRKTGWLSIAAGDVAVHLRQHAERLISFDIATELLTPQEVKYRYPELNTEDIELGTFGPDDGPFDAHMIMSGLTLFRTARTSPASSESPIRFRASSLVRRSAIPRARTAWASC